MATDLRHVVVLMLENRSFDTMLGRLHPAGAGFDGLAGTEANVWHHADGSRQRVPVWTDPVASARTLRIPDPDPGESFADIHMQIHGLTDAGAPEPGPPAMGGFVDNYMRQPAADPAADPAAVMHGFSPAHVPVISQLGRAFAVSDRWHAAAPCQTWPNRFFTHTGTAGGYVDNTPHFPYTMDTVFDRLAGVGQSFRIYFHDIPQSATLSRLWGAAGAHFRRFEETFAADAATGALPAYSFIEPRYFTAPFGGALPNDQHPPHDVGHGEALIASVYNALRAGPGWRQTLLVITYDEHGGCYDHVVPPPAISPGGPAPDGFDFGYFGVRVPAVIVSPRVPAGGVVRPTGLTPFDHTSIIATLARLFGFAPLTPRDAAAPDLLGALAGAADNDGPAAIAVPPAPAMVAGAADRPLNDLQASLVRAAAQLPTAGADIDAHVRRLAAVASVAPAHASVGAAAADVDAHMRAFLGER